MLTPFDDIGVNEAITPERANQFVLDFVAPACRAHGERWKRDGSTSIARFDRQRGLYVVPALTLAPGHTFAGVSAGVTTSLNYMFGFPAGATGKLHRVYCRDGTGNVNEFVEAITYSATNVQIATLFGAVTPPFDITNLNATIDTGVGFVGVQVENGAGVIQPVNYRVTFQFALDFAAGVS